MCTEHRPVADNTPRPNHLPLPPACHVCPQALRHAASNSQHTLLRVARLFARGLMRWALSRWAYLVAVKHAIALNFWANHLLFRWVGGMRHAMPCAARPKPRKQAGRRGGAQAWRWRKQTVVGKPAKSDQPQAC